MPKDDEFDKIEFDEDFEIEEFNGEFDEAEIVSNYDSDDGVFYSPGKNRVEYDDNDEPLTDTKAYRERLKQGDKPPSNPRNFNNLDKMNRSLNGIQKSQANRLKRANEVNGVNMTNRTSGNKNRNLNASNRQRSYTAGYNPNPRDPYGGDYRSSAKPPVRRQKPQKSQYTIFYVLTLCTGVVICIILMVVMFDMFAGTSNILPSETVQATPSPNIADTTVEPTPIPTEIASGAKEVEIEMTGFIISVDSTNNTLTVMDPYASKTHQLTSVRTTDLRNKYGEILVFGQLKAGDIVNTVYYEHSEELISLNLSPLAWEFENIKDLNIDGTARTVTMGNSTYSVHDNAIITKKGQEYTLPQISSIDSVTIRGLRDDLFYLNVTESHGYISFVGGEGIKNGAIEIDTKTFLKVAQTGVVDVTEGSHRIVVKGDNIEPFIQEINVLSGETVQINLAQLVEIKSGNVVIKVNQTDYTAYINGELVNLQEPITATYGTHSLRVEKEGFEAFETEFVVASSYNTVEATLNERIEMCEVSIITTPEECDLYIDSNYVGTSEIEIPVEYGNHTITVSKAGYLTQSFDVELLAKERGFWFVLSVDPNYTTDPQISSTPVPSNTQTQVTMPQTSQAPTPTEEATSSGISGAAGATAAPSDTTGTTSGISGATGAVTVPTTTTTPTDPTTTTTQEPQATSSNTFESALENAFESAFESALDNFLGNNTGN